MILGRDPIWVLHNRSMASIPDARISPSEYLRRERLAEEKSEYVDGFVYAMSGAKLPHNIIAANVMGLVSAQLRGGPCRPLSNDMKVRTPSSGMYSYPDMTVVCGKPVTEDEEQDVLLNPTVIIEILSPSTEKWDRGGKFARYQSISSLQDYVLVSQEEPRVERFSREDDGWKLVSADSLESSFSIPSIKVNVAMADVYDGIEFDPFAPPKS